MYKQFKLTNNEEIVCEVLDQDDSDSRAPDVIIRNVLKIVVVENWEKNVRYYTFKPWMSFVDDTDELMSLNSVHVVGECTPSKQVMRHYNSALEEVARYNKIKQAGLDIEAIHEEAAELTEEEMEAYLENKYAEIEKQLAEAEIKIVSNLDMDDSSDPSNVIVFKPKGTLH